MDSILSVYFGYHDSCITFSTQGSILLHLEAERIFREKHIKVSESQMRQLIKIGLNHLQLDINDFNTLYLAQWNNRFIEEKVSICGKVFEPIITKHHENHIGTSYPSNFDNALIICADGGSEDGCTKFYLKTGSNLRLIADFSDEIITGRFYGTITQMIIDPDFSKAHKAYPGKTMGLSALGSFSEEFYHLLNEHKTSINNLHIEGIENLRKIFKLSDDYSQPWLDKRRCDLAFTAQNFWQSLFIEKIKNYASLSENICLVGGCSLNVLLNSAIVDSRLFQRIYVSPISGDGGQSLGAILFHHPNIDCAYPYLGQGFGDLDEVPQRLIEDLLQHKIVAWYQGRSEIGARALGHRSLFGLPDSHEMKIKISELVKRREPYRPVAPILPSESFFDFFDSANLSPFMTYAPRAKEITNQKAPAIVHIDGTSRVQTLASQDNEVLHTILRQIGEETGVPILMNTSFNIGNEPIVDTPDDALSSFISSEADVLYINGQRYARK